MDFDNNEISETDLDQTTPEPLQPQHASMEKSEAKPVFGSKLTKKQSIIVGVVIGLVVIAIGTFVGIWFGLIKKKNNGNKLFGQIVIQDTTSSVQNVFQPGDSLILKFNPNTGDGFSGLSNWYVSIDGGQTYDTIDTDVAGNTVNYAIDPTLCSTGLMFKVEDSDHTHNFVTTKVFTVQPSIKIQTGPGVQSGTIVYINTLLTSQLEFDSTLKNTSLATDWKIDTSLDSTFSSPIEQTIQSYDSTSQTLTWTIAKPLSKAYVRFTLTNNPGTCTTPIFVISQYTFNATTLDPCAGTTFKIQSVYILAKGVIQNVFYPGQAVELQFVYCGTYKAPSTWSYIIDGSTTTSITNQGSEVVTSSTVTVSWTVPTDLFTPSFQLNITSESVQGHSANLIVRPTLTLETPLTKVSISSIVLPTFEYNVLTTNVQSSPNDTYTSWEVGFSTDPDSITPTYLQATSTNVDALYTVNVQFTPTILGFKNVGDSSKLYLFFKAIKSSTQFTIVRTASTVEFTLLNFAPAYGQIIGINYDTSVPSIWVYDKNVSPNIRSSVVTTIPPVTSYWFPIILSSTLKELLICQYVPGATYNSTSDIMCAISNSSLLNMESYSSIKTPSTISKYYPISANHTCFTFHESNEDISTIIQDPNIQITFSALGYNLCIVSPVPATVQYTWSVAPTS